VRALELAITFGLVCCSAGCFGPVTFQESVTVNRRPPWGASTYAQVDICPLSSWVGSVVAAVTSSDASLFGDWRLQTGSTEGATRIFSVAAETLPYSTYSETYSSFVTSGQLFSLFPYPAARFSESALRSLSESPWTTGRLLHCRVVSLHSVEAADPIRVMATVTKSFSGVFQNNISVVLGASLELWTITSYFRVPSDTHSLFNGAVLYDREVWAPYEESYTFGAVRLRLARISQW